MPVKSSRNRLISSTRLRLTALAIAAASWGCSDISDLPELPELPAWAGGPKAAPEATPPAADADKGSDTDKPETPSQPVTAQATPSQFPLATVIVSKGAVVSPIDQKTLSLSYAVTGGPVSVTINEFRFFCKREYEKSFSNCPDGYKYDFADLKSGSSYTLTVQAVSISTGAVAKPDSITFQVK
ncbi:MAG: hypothetical protein FJ146_07425 [Deltaproteobacteria bacterium]|nr:hypothetical protein [Deltaproteobacteria bacterium]